MEYRPIGKPAPGFRPTELDRHCTDCLFCLLFGLFVATFAGVAVYGFTQGNPSLILYPFDISGNQCGRPDSATSDHPYLYYLDPLNNPVFSVCVRDCAWPCSTYHPNPWVVGCVSGLGFGYREKDSGSVTYALEYSGADFLGRFCLPEKSTAQALYSAVSGEIQAGGALEWAQDVLFTWSASLAVLGISLFLSLFYMGLLRSCTALVVYLSILAVLVAIVGVGLGIQYQADLNYNTSAQETDYTVLTYLSYACYGACGLFLVLILFMWRRIKLAIAIMKCAVEFMGATCSILLVPIVSFAVSVGLVMCWLLALGYLYSCGSVEHKDQYTTFGNVEWQESARRVFYFEAVAIVWLVEFLHLYTQLVLALVVCFWYFGRGKQQNCTICTAIYTALRYHIGSVALASLLVSIVKLVKWLLYYIQKHLYVAHFQGNELIKFFCLCLSCYMDCFERFLQYIDKNALITMTYTGQSFCSCAQEVFELLGSNGARFLALGSLGELLSLLGKALITALAAGTGFFLVTETDHYREKLTSPIAPVVVFALIAYCVSSLFMSVFEITCDCILVLYLEDEKRSGTKALMSAPEPLHRFMEEERGREDGSCC